MLESGGDKSCTLCRLNEAAFMRRRTLIIALTKIAATVLATEIMLLPGYPTASWLVLLHKSWCLLTPKILGATV